MDQKQTDLPAIREGDICYLSEEAARRDPNFARIAGKGGVVKKVCDGIAELHVTYVFHVQVGKLRPAGSGDAFDPIP